jgi:hypothetical protein
MQRLQHFACLLALAAFIFVPRISAQQPTPAQVVVQTATAPKSPVVVKPVVATADNPTSLQAALKALKQTKASNDETLKKQEALLEQLDELQKAAEQLKIFAKRG